MNPIQLPRIEAGIGAELPASGGKAAGAAAGSFADALRSVAEPSTRATDLANQQIEKLASGQSDDLHSVEIAIQKADLAFQLLLQVRNKVLHAYQEIMQMQV